MTTKRPKADRMATIIEAALSEFLEKGFETATMESIALRAGLSKGGLYHHFRSKDEILLYANQKMNEPVAEMMARAGREASAVRALRGYIRAYLRHWQGRPQELVFYSLSMTRVLADTKLWRMYEEYTEGMLAFFQGILDRGVASGELAAHDSRGRAVALLGALDGIAFYLIIDRKLSLGRVCGDIEAALLAPLLKKNPKGGPRP